MRKILILLFTAMLLLCVPVAAEEPVTYQVTIYAGNQGDFGGAKEKTFTVTKGSRFNLSLDDLGFQVTNDTYYCKGFKEAGYDNDEGTLAQSFDFEVTEDVSFVVTYGIPGEMISYTVKYVNQNGDDMLAPATYHGNKGDTLIVAAKYIPNYLPNSFNRSFELTEDGQTITFIYSPAPANTRYIYETVYGPGGGGGGTPGGGGGVEPTPTPTPTPEPSPEPEPVIPEVIPDEPTPSTDPGQKDDDSSGIGYLIPAGLGVTAGVGLLIWLLSKRKKDEEEDENSENSSEE